MARTRYRLNFWKPPKSALSGGLPTIYIFWDVLILKSLFLCFVSLDDGCDEVLTEFCGEDAVDLCFDHAASLIDFHDRMVFAEAFAYHVGLYFFCGGFNEFGLGVYDLAKDVIALDSKIRRLGLQLLFLWFSLRVSLVPFARLGPDSFRGWLRR